MKLSLPLSSAAACLLLAGCTSAPVVQSDKIQVATTIYPLAQFAQQVGGDLVHVTQLTPSGVEAHDYEPSPRDIATMQEADIFVSNGAGIDAWADKLIDGTLRNTSTLRMADAMTLMPAVASEEHDNEHEEEHGHEGLLDPHIWLDPMLAQQEASLIATVLKEKDPAHTATYDANLEAFSRRLDELDAEFQNGLAHCASRTVIVAHDAFHYLGKRYNLNIVPIAGLSPEEEPSAQKLAEIIEIARAAKATTIFFEPFTSPKLSETIASELTITTSILNPLEGVTAEEAASGTDYFTLMAQNLKNLRTALQCQ